MTAAARPTAAVAPGVDRDPWPSPEALDRGLAIAARASALSFLALPAPLVGASSIIDALREMARVVRPGGRIAILELGEPRQGLLARAARFHTRHVVPRLGALLSGAREYRYLQRSIAAFPPSAEFAQVMAHAGLRVIEVVPLTFGVCTLYVATPAEAS